MQLHAKVTSDGPDVLLVHGVTDNLHTWDRITPALATRARVHAVDLPGHGGSPIPDRPLRMAEMARALSGYLDEAGITRCVVVGNSVGGGVSLMLAASEPDRVRGVVTLGSVGLPSRFPIHLRLLDLWGTAELMRLVAPFPRLARSFMRFMFHRDYAIPRAQVEGYFSGWRARERPRYIRRQMRALDVAEPAPLLGGIRAHVHLVHGDSDIVVPPRIGRELAAAIPNAELTVLERTGHAPQNERPDATAAIIHGMLDAASLGFGFPVRAPSV